LLVVRPERIARVMLQSLPTIRGIVESSSKEIVAFILYITFKIASLLQTLLIRDCGEYNTSNSSVSNKEIA